jgi:hypothetical protein
MEVINFIEKLNWQTIVAMFAIGWYFTRDIRVSLNKLDADVRAQGARTDKLYELYCEGRKEIDQKFYDILRERK